MHRNRNVKEPPKVRAIVNDVRVAFEGLRLPGNDYFRAFPAVGGNHSGAATPWGLRAARSASDCSSSMESVDVYSVEEQQPFNAKMVAVWALLLHRTSAEVLRAYKCVKRDVQQQLYRRYYMKWLRILARASSKSTSTQTEWCEQSRVSCSMSTMTWCSTMRDSGQEHSTPPHLCSSACRKSADTNDTNVTSDTPRGLHANCRKHDRPSSLLPGMLVTHLSGHSAVHAPPASSQSLRSNSTPSLLHDYGHPSQPPRRPHARLEDFPTTRLPLLVCSCHGVIVLLPHAITKRNSADATDS